MTILSAWHSRRAAVVCCAILIVVTATQGLLKPTGIASLALFAGIAFRYSVTRHTYEKWAIWLVLIIGAFAFGMHLVPGFEGIKIIEKTTIGNAISYEKWASIDKPVAVLLILVLALPGLVKPHGLLSVFRSTLPITIVTVVIVSSAAYLAGYVNWDFTPHPIFPVWAILNLITCFSEEVVFRGLIQSRISVALRPCTSCTYIPLLVAAALFGIAHIGGGWLYALLATIAGVGYGYAYQKTERIEAAIFVHFMVNTFHFLFLSYPKAA